MMPSLDSFKCRRSLKAGARTYSYFSLPAAEKNGLAGISELSFSLKILLENLLRHEDGRTVTRQTSRPLPPWISHRGKTGNEIAFRPARVLMQDFTGVPAVVDLAAMRDAMKLLGGDPRKINPLAPVNIVIDNWCWSIFSARRSLSPEREAGIRAQCRALHLPEMGPAGF